MYGPRRGLSGSDCSGNDRPRGTAHRLQIPRRHTGNCRAACHRIRAPGIGQDIRVIARFKGVVPGQVVGDPVPDGGRCGKDMHHGPGLWVGIEAACGNIDCIAIAG